MTSRRREKESVPSDSINIPGETERRVLYPVILAGLLRPQDAAGSKEISFLFVFGVYVQLEMKGCMRVRVMP